MPLRGRLVGGGGIGFGGGGGGGIAGGAGGGGGYGGGGGSTNFAGGGGGSSFVIPTGTITSAFAANQNGNGQVTITYDPTTDSCPTPLVVAPRFTG